MLSQASIQHNAPSERNENAADVNNATAKTQR